MPETTVRYRGRKSNNDVYYLDRGECLDGGRHRHHERTYERGGEYKILTKNNNDYRNNIYTAIVTNFA